MGPVPQPRRGRGRPYQPPLPRLAGHAEAPAREGAIDSARGRLWRASRRRNSWCRQATSSFVEFAHDGQPAQASFTSPPGRAARTPRPHRAAGVRGGRARRNEPRNGRACGHTYAYAAFFSRGAHLARTAAAGAGEVGGGGGSGGDDARDAGRRAGAVGGRLGAREGTCECGASSGGCQLRAGWGGWGTSSSLRAGGTPCGPLKRWPPPPPGGRWRRRTRRLRKDRRSTTPTGWERSSRMVE